TPLRPYLAWLAERDAVATQTFWRGELQGVNPVALGVLQSGGVAGGERHLELSAAETAALATFARERRMTTNAVVSAIWALWLGAVTSHDDVTFGLAVSVRPEEIPGIEQLVGMCINNLPARLQYAPADRVDDTLTRFARQQNAMLPHAHASLLELQRWSELPWHRRLFDTLVVFQHDVDDGEGNWLGEGTEVTLHH